MPKKLDQDKYYMGNENLPKSNNTYVYTEKEAIEYERCLKNILYFAENFFWIINLDEGRQKIKLHNYQKRMIRCMVDNRFSIFCASRQIGKTTVMSIYALWLLVFFEDKKILLVANKEDTAKEIFGRIRMAYEELPNYLKPGTAKYGETAMTLDNGSGIKISSTSSNAGRGLSCNCLILDEFSHIPQHIISAYWKAVYPIISSSKTAKIIASSTPNRTGNLFHKLFTEAVAGKNGWAYESVPWYDVPGRDQKWKEDEIRKMGNREDFLQEFECVFLDDGDSIIDYELKDRMVVSVRDPEYIFDNGSYKMWDTYKQDHIYAIGVDIAEGVGEDSSVIQVFDITDLTNIVQVAVYSNNKITPPKFTKKVFDIARNWGSPPLAIERNNCGGQVVDNIFNHYKYSNLINIGPAKTVHKNKNYDRMGVIAHTNTKSQGINNMRYWMSEAKTIVLRDQDTIDELETFIRNPNGTWSARSGCHDDLVMSMIWSLVVLDNKIVEQYYEVMEWDDYNNPKVIIKSDYGIDHYIDPNSMYSNEREDNYGDASPIIMPTSTYSDNDMEMADLMADGWELVG